MNIRNFVRYSGLAAGLVGITSFVSAQTVDKKTPLTLQGAERVIAAAKAEAQRLQAPGGVIPVCQDRAVSYPAGVPGIRP